MAEKKKKELNGKSEIKPKFKKLKTFDELENGRCIIVTDHGKIASCVGSGMQTLLPVPNGYTIYGFIQNKRTQQKPAKTKNINKKLVAKRIKQGEKLLEKERKIAANKTGKKKRQGCR